jgi:hypothetical protein
MQRVLTRRSRQREEEDADPVGFVAKLATTAETALFRKINETPMPMRNVEKRVVAFVGAIAAEKAVAEALVEVDKVEAMATVALSRHRYPSPASGRSLPSQSAVNVQLK